MKQRRGTLVGDDEVYFLLELGNGILKCDLGRGEMSVIRRLPPTCIRSRVERAHGGGGRRGGLGFAVVRVGSQCPLVVVWWWWCWEWRMDMDATESR
jgi:hypothetical protein